MPFAFAGALTAEDIPRDLQLCYSTCHDKLVSFIFARKLLGRFTEEAYEYKYTEGFILSGYVN